MAEAQQRGLAVPRCLSVLGFNDIPEAAAADQALTVIDARNAEKGKVAAEMVLCKRHARRELLRPEIQIRSSTAPAPIEQPQRQ